MRRFFGAVPGHVWLAMVVAFIIIGPVNDWLLDGVPAPFNTSFDMASGTLVVLAFALASRIWGKGRIMSHITPVEVMGLLAGSALGVVAVLLRATVWGESLAYLGITLLLVVGGALMWRTARARRSEQSSASL